MKKLLAVVFCALTAGCALKGMSDTEKTAVLNK